MDLPGFVRRFSRSSTIDSSDLEDTVFPHHHDAFMVDPPLTGTNQSTSSSSVSPPPSSAMFSGKKSYVGCPQRPTNLTVDTSVLRDYKSKTNTFDGATLFRKASMPPMMNSIKVPDNNYPKCEKTDIPSDLTDHSLRRRRSNSECLFMMKQYGAGGLTGQCKEYFTHVKQSLARTEEQQTKRDGIALQRRRSMSLRDPPVLKEAVYP